MDLVGKDDLLELDVLPPQALDQVTVWEKGTLRSSSP